MIQLNSTSAAYICKLVVALKKLGLFKEKDDDKFWHDLAGRIIEK